MLWLVASIAGAQDKKPEPPTRIGKHLLTAEALLEEIAPEHTSYRHKNNVVKRKSAEAPAECHADCSGFINWLLLEATGKPPAALEQWFRSKRPVARHYVDAIVTEKFFRRIHRLKDCLPGDVVAMKYPKGNDNTGHVMLVAERPKKRVASAPLVEETEQWDLKIIDCTTSPHGSDSRKKEAGSRGGLGTGLFRIYTNADGEPVGYTWGPGPKSEYRAMKDRLIVVGRFKSNGNSKGDSVETVELNAIVPVRSVYVGKDPQAQSRSDCIGVDLFPQR